MHNLIGTTEAARMAGTDVATIKRAARSGELPPTMKLPGKTGAYLFAAADVAAYVAARADRRAA